MKDKLEEIYNYVFNYGNNKNNLREGKLIPVHFKWALFYESKERADDYDYFFNNVNSYKSEFGSKVLLNN